MTFLPKNYEVPQAPSNYMKFQDGLNRFRVLDSAITGFEYFTVNNKPVRSKEAFDSTPADIKDNGKVKAFWAFPVWNYQTESVQILELTQKTIMNNVLALVNNPKWGDPKMYDIAVTRQGEGLDTEYQVQAEPPIMETGSEILKAFKAKEINLNALFDGQDPFAK